MRMGLKKGWLDAATGVQDAGGGKEPGEAGRKEEEVTARAPRSHAKNHPDTFSSSERVGNLSERFARVASLS